MATLKVNQGKVTPKTANELIDICPFGAIDEENGKLIINSNCKMCKICVKKGPKGVIELVEDKKIKKVNKREWKGITVYVDHVEGEIHPVTYELIGKAKELAKKVDYPVYCLFIGNDIKEKAKNLLEYGVDEVFVYDYKELNYFRIEPYTLAFEDFINKLKPSIILVGATTTGRSLAPRVAARFRTGLTADCTILDIQKNTDLIQIRPAYGGNIMAKIKTTNSRPQLATVRYKVMDAASKCENISGRVTSLEIDSSKFNSNIEVIKITKKEKEENISEADIVVAVGKAIKNEDDLKMAEELANILGGQLACTRPIIENGLIEPKRQIGLSGRTVKPKLIITLGISGSVQFIAGMNSSEYIFAINKDPEAAIFNIAHYSIVGDIFEIVPDLIEEIKKQKDIELKECIGIS